MNHESFISYTSAYMCICVVDEDFEKKTQIVTFAANNNEQCIKVTIFGREVIVKNDRVFNVTIIDGTTVVTNATIIAGNDTTVVITDASKSDKSCMFTFAMYYCLS